MDHIVIEGVPPHDGRYEFDLKDSAFTVREWGWIKRLSGYLPLTLWDGWRSSDAELMATFGIIALVRAGKIDRDDVPDVWERFQEAPGVMTIRIEFAAEDDADPSSPESLNGNTGSSGPATPTSSESLTEILPASGIRGSASSASHPAPASAT